MAAKKPTTKTPKTKADTAKEFDEVAGNLPDNSHLSERVLAEMDQKNAGVRASVADLSPEKMAAQVTQTQLKITSILQNVQAEVVTELQVLQNVKDAVQLEKNELERLHGVDVVQAKVADLVAEHDEKMETLEKEYEDASARLEAQDTAKTEALEKEFTEKTAALNAKFEADHAILKQRIIDTQKQEQERATAENIRRDREQEQYAYNLAQNRKKEQDVFEATLRERNRNEQLRLEALNKEWTARSEALTASENEVTELRAEVAEFPARLKDAVAKAESIVGNTVKRDYEYKMTLAAKDAESALSLANAKIASQIDVIASKEAQIAKLQSALDAAQEKQSIIATKALEASSGQAALMELRNVNRNDQNGTSKKS